MQRGGIRVRKARGIVKLLTIQPGRYGLEVGREVNRYHNVGVEMIGSLGGGLGLGQFPVLELLHQLLEDGIQFGILGPVLFRGCGSPLAILLARLGTRLLIGRRLGRRPAKPRPSIEGR